MATPPRTMGSFKSGFDFRASITDKAEASPSASAAAEPASEQNAAIVIEVERFMRSPEMPAKAD